MTVGTITGGIKLFPKASPVDGKLELAAVTASTALEWARVLARVATGHAERSPFVKTTRATRITVELQTKESYEMDGSDREPSQQLKFRVKAGAITICVPKRLRESHAKTRRRAGT